MAGGESAAGQLYWHFRSVVPAHDAREIRANVRVRAAAAAAGSGASFPGDFPRPGLASSRHRPVNRRRKDAVSVRHPRTPAPDRASAGSTVPACDVIGGRWGVCRWEPPLSLRAGSCEEEVILN